MSDSDWHFWIDRGGTFTDIIGLDPDGRAHTLKLLSERPDSYRDAAIEGMRRVLADSSTVTPRIASVRMGTTVATNALLQRRGEPTALLMTAGLADVLRIGTQQRPDIFALDIDLPPMLYSAVIEAHERIDASGTITEALDEDRLRSDLATLAGSGIASIAIVFMHAWRNAVHEQRAAEIAAAAGLTQISVSHEVSPTVRIVPRGDTTLVDAYLTPVLAQHVATVRSGLEEFSPSARLEFMQSHGGLTEAAGFRGCNSILSGPAGGVVGMAKAAVEAGREKVIGFDMGGTSTDVSLYAGEFERTNDTLVSGVRIATPMLHIHTIAAGGGSIVRFADGRLQVGPDSAGALPGPAAYRNGGPLTLTDANLLLGRIQREHFPAVFGPTGDATLDLDAVNARFETLAEQSRLPVMQLAEGALDIAVERMAQAIREISTRRGIDLEDFTLSAFGGAGGQHACRVADSLGIETVFIHPMAGLLSALGIGLAEQRRIRTLTIERTLTAEELPKILETAQRMSGDAIADFPHSAQSGPNVVWRAHIRCRGSDTNLAVTLNESMDCASLEHEFCAAYRAQFGYAPPLPAVVDTLEIETIAPSARSPSLSSDGERPAFGKFDDKSVYFDGCLLETPVVHREQLEVGTSIPGPVLIIETNSTTVVEPGWLASRDDSHNLILRRVERETGSAGAGVAPKREPDPVRLELFNNAFMHAAEQMGVVLQRAAHSVNIKERQDFSCAVFSETGDLIANAPHVPVHLGSMGETVKALLRDHAAEIARGNVLMSNDPLRGGTHLPDVTVVSPVFLDDGAHPSFLVASRAHHADVGGMTPGSMPPFSRNSDDEGALFHGIVIVRDGALQAQAVRDAFAGARIPARNPGRNLADIQAQIAANTRGILELERLTARYGLDLCRRYVGFMYDNAAAAVRQALGDLHDGRASVRLDTGERIAVAVRIDHSRGAATIDFTGTSATSSGNLNAPSAIAKSAVLYTLRVLVAHDIPLNSGCLDPVELQLPEDCLVNPRSGVAVVGGNVETSQRIVDALMRAFGVLASSQGTMNNLTFGNDRLQYYETICGGAGASASARGADAVHTHMTNSRLTDPEILEWRFPVQLRRFAVRDGSGGRGEHNGGNGVIRELEFLQSMTVALLSNCRSVAPHGVAGGGAAMTGRNTVVRGDGTVEHLAGTAQFTVEPGDRLILETPGGGAFGAAI